LKEWTRKRLAGSLEAEGFGVAIEEDTAPDRKGQVIDQRPGLAIP